MFILRLNSLQPLTGSTDDDKIVSYKWEEVSSPLQSRDLNTEGQMLTVKGLVPGNYTFRYSSLFFVIIN